MVAPVKIAPFGGMLPALDDTQLPAQAAALSQNCWLYSGVLTPMKAPELLHVCVQQSTEKVFRLPNSYTDASHLSNADWLEFTDIDTDVVHTPVVGDQFDRYYWASSSVAPMYNTRAAIKAATPPLLLGIPPPETAPAVVPAGGVGVAETRSYVYTWVSAYGEEGPPSPPTTVTGKIDDTWAITLTAPLVGDTTQRNLTRVRIYRTITAVGGNTTFFLVIDQAIGTLVYNDALTDTVVATHSLLQSTNWSGPPATLQGLVSMPNGMIAGWTGQEVWFCEPFRPHAWPVAYVEVVDFPIVGMGAIGQTLVVLTQGNPYVMHGVNPASISQSKIATFEPCLSRGSILSSPEGVYWASPNGLMLCDGYTAVNVTRTLITKDLWQKYVPLLTLRAARFGQAYYAWGSALPGVFSDAFDPLSFTQQDQSFSFQGVLIDPTNQHVAFNTLTNANACINVMNDIWSSEVFIIRNNTVYWLDTQNTTNPIYEVGLWRSRKWQAPLKKNFGVARIRFGVPATTPAQGARNTAFPQLTLGGNQYGILRVYADDRLVATREIFKDNELIRLPSGFTAEYWQFEIESRVIVRSLEVAISAKELASV